MFVSFIFYIKENKQDQTLNTFYFKHKSGILRHILTNLENKLGLPSTISVIFCAAC